MTSGRNYTIFLLLGRYSLVQKDTGMDFPLHRPASFWHLFLLHSHGSPAFPTGTLLSALLLRQNYRNVQRCLKGIGIKN